MSYFIKSGFWRQERIAKKGELDLNHLITSLLPLPGFTLTTNGTSGPSTLIGSVLNIPQYSGGGGSGTVTSFAFTNGGGFTGVVSNASVTPTLSLTLQNATTSQAGQLTSADWNTFNSKQSAISFGTGVQTALSLNIGVAGAVVLFNGAGGTPSSLTLTNATGLPNTGLLNSSITIASNITALGTSVTQDQITGLSFNGIVKRTGANTLAIATAGIDYQAVITFGTGVLASLAVNIGSAGAPILFNGSAGTPSSIVLTNGTGLPSTSVLSGTFVNGMSATTQTFNDNSTKIATTAYVDKNQTNKIFYVDDYGAKGDSNGTTGNGTDNTTAINNALTAISSNGGGILLFGKGKYRFTSKLDITNNNIKIEGLGWGISSLYYDPSGTSDNKAINLSGTNCIFSSLSVFSNNDHSGSYTSAMLGTTGSQIIIENCEFYNGNFQGIVLLAGSYITITKCHVHDSPKGGIRVSSPISESVTASYITVTNNKIHDLGDDGIGVSFNSLAHNIIVSNNNIYNTATGVSVYGYDPTPTHSILVSDNNIGSTFLAGIQIKLSVGSIRDLQVIGNEIEDAGLWVPSGSQYMAAVGVAAGIMIDTYGASLSYYMDDIVVIDNKIKNCRNNVIGIGQGLTNVTYPNLGQIGNLIVKNNAGTNLSITGGAGSPALGTGSSQTPGTTQYAAIGVLAPNRISNSIIDISNNTITNVSREIFRLETSSTGIYAIKNNTSTLGNRDNASLNAYDLGSNSGITLEAYGNSTTQSYNAYTAVFITNAATVVGPRNLNPIFSNSNTTSNIATFRDGETTVASVVDGGLIISTVNIAHGFTSTATAAGTTTLTSLSTRFQAFTGSTTQTVKLPVVTTLTNGHTFYITNASSGTVTVQTSGANTIKAMAANSTIQVWVVNTGGGTGTASWNWSYNATGLNN